MNDPIVPFPKFGAGIGLHRVGAIAAAIGVDLAAFSARACVITGSNGKGSVAAMTGAILAAAQPDVGVFTSPHLFSIHERFAIDGDPIDDAALAAHWERVEAAARAYERDHPGDAVGGFEFLFLIAASWFCEQHCAFTVWEAGIGGRYDPTRLIRAPYAALVSLDLEHTALLGDTLEEIAYDKLDAAAAGGQVWIGAQSVPRTRMDAYCAVRGVAPSYVRDWRVVDEAHIGLDIGGSALILAPPLAGPHQRVNTAIAARLSYAMMRDEGVSDDEARAAIVAGLAATRWPGRLETIEHAPPVVIDVGHTPEAIRLAREGFLSAHAPGVLVCGASADKACEPIIAALAPDFRVIVCVAARHKGRAAAEIAAMASAANPGAEVIVAEHMRDARQTALARAHALGAAVYVAGGLFLAAEFKAAHLGLAPERLHFF